MIGNTSLHVSHQSWILPARSFEQSIDQLLISSTSIRQCAFIEHSIQQLLFMSRESPLISFFGFVFVRIRSLCSTCSFNSSIWCLYFVARRFSSVRQKWAATAVAICSQKVRLSVKTIQGSSCFSFKVRMNSTINDDVSFDRRGSNRCVIETILSCSLLLIKVSMCDRRRRYPCENETQDKRIWTRFWMRFNAFTASIGHWARLDAFTERTWTHFIVEMRPNARSTSTRVFCVLLQTRFSAFDQRTRLIFGRVCFFE